MRLQILELPLVQNPDETMTTPFILVASEVAPFASREQMEAVREDYRRLKENVGAAGFFVTHQAVEIGPAPERRVLDEADALEVIRRYYKTADARI